MRFLFVAVCGAAGQGTLLDVEGGIQVWFRAVGEAEAASLEEVLDRGYQLEMGRGRMRRGTRYRALGWVAILRWEIWEWGGEVREGGDEDR